jgi:sialate O-acetylesterase
MIKLRPTLSLLLLIFATATTAANAQLALPAIFGDHMVLQRGGPIPVWGTADAGAEVTVTLYKATQTTTAGIDGKWRLDLPSHPASGPHEMTVQTEEAQQVFTNVMIGEVWVCSGQSNMEWPIERIDDADLELHSANFPNIRLITVKRNAAQEPLDDFEGNWQVCSAQTLEDFSAVGYFFARRIHQATGVAVGLIDNSWGGSAAEAWLPRETLEADPQYAALMNWWEQLMSTYTEPDYQADRTAAQAKIAEWSKAGKRGPRPSIPRDDRNGQRRPANIYNGMVHPLLGYGIRGVIWYQGEANSQRAYQYRELFPLVIETMRERWGQGDFPFYWAQLADFRDEVSAPEDSAWAELREAQTMTLDRLDNVAQAVIIDAGEGRDIHPRDKQTVGDRLARIALGRDYGIPVAYQSPRMKSVEFNGNKAVVTFDHVDGSLYTFDVREPIGFSIAGEDQQFVFAQGKLVGNDQVEVWSPNIEKPVAVRYGWAENPVVNLYDKAGLPATPFRSDEWPGITINSLAP